MWKDAVLAAVRLRPTRLNATARRRFSPARRVAIRRLPCGAACAVSGSAEPCMPAGTSGTTWNPAGTWAAAYPWRRRLVRGDLRSVPSDGTTNQRRTTAGLHVGIQPTWVAVPRPAARAFQRRPQAPPGGVRAAAQRPRQGGGVQPPRLAITARSVVSTSEAGTDDAGNATSCKAVAVLSLNNG